MKRDSFNVLGIETSFDETAVSLVSSNGKILFEKLYNQLPLHERYGGVVPEIASRKHAAVLPQMINDSLKNNELDLSSVEAIAVTSGPGFIGSIIVGVMFAKGLAAVMQKPCIPVNHLAAHALTARLTNEVQFPYILLLVSGGHTQILVIKGSMDYQVLGGTLDDALGEAFDKIARMLDLPYPGGPAIEALAKSGNEKAFSLPKPMYKRSGCNFSFSGLKTAVRQIINKNGGSNNIDTRTKADICASFQYTVAEIIMDRLSNAIKFFRKSDYINLNANINVVIAGGVAANFYIRHFLKEHLIQNNCNLIVPEPKLCTDNGVMIAWAGIEIIKDFLSNHTAEEFVTKFSDMNFKPRSTWPLEEFRLSKI